MSMYRQILHLGIIIGLTASVFDGVYGFFPNTYYPALYPLLTIVFNLFFWVAVCICAACGVKIVSIYMPVTARRRPFIIPLFVLLPFAGLYGLLSKMNMDTRILNDAFDKHLSFLWAGCIVAVPIIFSARTRKAKRSASSFLPEIVSVIGIFIFCSNLSKLLELLGLVDSWAWSDSAAYSVYRMKLAAAYGIGVLCILACYAVAYFKTSLSVSNIKAELVLVCCVLAVHCFSTVKHYTAYTPHETIAFEKKSGKAGVSVPSVVLIVLDTARADRLPVYGNDRIKTPNLSDFIRDSLVYDRCIASSPWTLPSHASLFTGLYPAEHGSQNIVTEQKWFGTLQPSRPLDEKFVTLAEILKQHEYFTAGVVSNYLYLQPGFQLDQGFDYYYCRKNVGSVYNLPHKPIIHTMSFLLTVMPKLSLDYVVAEDITGKACRVLNRLHAYPFFLFLNYMDPHSPYRPPRAYSFWTFPQLNRIYNGVRGRLHRSDAMTNNDINLLEYDGELAYIDSQLGNIFQTMKDQGIYDSSLIVIVSDHGELFGENGFYGHKEVSMYNGVLHVPLMVKYPYAKKTGRTDEPFPLHRVFSLVLSACNLSVPGEDRNKPLSSTLAADYYDNTVGRHCAVFDGKYKYLWFEKNRNNQLYDISADPYEQTNLLDALPEMSVYMETFLQEWKRAYPPFNPELQDQENILSPDMRNGLKALGYIK